MRNRSRIPLLQLAVLALFVLSGSGVLPCLLGGLAKLAGGHTVGLTQSGGATVIVLGHDEPAEAGGNHAGSHDHSLLAEFVLSFSAGRDGDADHLIAISSSEFFRQYETSRPTPVAAPASFLRFRQPGLRTSPVSRRVTPRRPATTTAHLRTVVMLV